MSTPGLTALAVIAHDAYWRCKEVGEPPPFDAQPMKLQQCWLAAAQAVSTATIPKRQSDG